MVSKSFVLALVFQFGLHGCMADVETISCSAQRVNIGYEWEPVRCTDYTTNDGVVQIFNWDTVTNKARSVNAILLSATNTATPPSSCPTPALGNDPHAARSIIAGGWTQEPAGLGAPAQSGDAPWYVSGVTVGFNENGVDVPGVKIAFDGWVDFYGNIVLCGMTLTRPNGNYECVC